MVDMQKGGFIDDKDEIPLEKSVENNTMESI